MQKSISVMWMALLVNLVNRTDILNTTLVNVKKISLWTAGFSHATEKFNGWHWPIGKMFHLGQFFAFWNHQFFSRNMVAHESSIFCSPVWVNKNILWGGGAWTWQPCVKPFCLKVTSRSTVWSQSVSHITSWTPSGAIHEGGVSMNLTKFNLFCISLQQVVSNTFCKQSNQVSPFVWVCLQKYLSCILRQLIVDCTSLQYKKKCWYLTFCKCLMCCSIAGSWAH